MRTLKLSASLFTCTYKLQIITNVLSNGPDPTGPMHVWKFYNPAQPVSSKPVDEPVRCSTVQFYALRETPVSPLRVMVYVANKCAFAADPKVLKMNIG